MRVLISHFLLLAFAWNLTASAAPPEGGGSEEGIPIAPQDATRDSGFWDPDERTLHAMFDIPINAGQGAFKKEQERLKTRFGSDTDDGKLVRTAWSFLQEADNRDLHVAVVGGLGIDTLQRGMGKFLLKTHLAFYEDKELGNEQATYWDLPRRLEEYANYVADHREFKAYFNDDRRMMLILKAGHIRHGNRGGMWRGPRKFVAAVAVFAALGAGAICLSWLMKGGIQNEPRGPEEDPVKKTMQKYQPLPSASDMMLPQEPEHFERDAEEGAEALGDSFEKRMPKNYQR